MQVSLAHHIASGMSIAAASRLSGYADINGAAAALSLPAVQSAIRQRLDALLLQDAAFARKTLRRMVGSTKLDAKTRRQAAVDLLSRGGFVAPKAKESAAGNRSSLSELTPHELRAVLAEAQRALSDRAPIIDGESQRIAPDPAPDDNKLAELLG